MRKKPKLPKGCFWRGEVIWARAQVDGRDHKCSLRRATPAQAKGLREQWVEELRRASPRSSHEKHTWQDACERWGRELLAGLKPSTAKRYLCSLHMVRPILDHLYLDEIGRRELAEIAGRAGPSIATRRRDLDAVAVVLQAAEAWDWIDVAPDFRRARRGLRERREPIRPPSDAEIAAVMAKAPERFGRLIMFARLTGMRQEEAASLERRSIDFRKGEAQLWSTKTSRPRRINLRTVVGDAMAVVEAVPPRIGCRWLFWHGDGDRFENVSSRFAGLCRRAGVRFRFHDLRHRFAYDWLTNGGDIYALSKHLGHRSVKITDEIYGGWARHEPGEAGTETRNSEVG